MARMIKKYTITFRGHKKIFAHSMDEAKKSVDAELKYIHPNFNMKFESITEEEQWTRVNIQNTKQEWVRYTKSIL